MRIKAAVSRTAGAPLEIEELTLDAPRDQEVLVRLKATGICHLDITLRDSATLVPRPIVLGHEGAGVVEQVGQKVTQVAVGDPVVISFDSCGQCSNCREGVPAYCYNIGARLFGGSRPDGSTSLSKNGRAIHSHFFGQSSFATHAICTERNTVKVSMHLPLELLGPLGCGIQTGAGAVLNALRVSPGSSLAVFGAGSVGLAAVMAARIAGAAKITAVDVHESRLELARSLGATDTIKADAHDIGAKIVSGTTVGLNFTIDTTGDPAVVRLAVDCLAPRGVFGLISTAKSPEVTLNALRLLQGGRMVRGIHQGDSVPQKFIPQLINYYLEGRFPFDRLVTFYPFERINDAMHDAETGKTIKAVLRM